MKPPANRRDWRGYSPTNADCRTSVPPSGSWPKGPQSRSSFTNPIPPARIPRRTPARPADRPTASAFWARPSRRCCRCLCPRCSEPRTSTAARSARSSSPTASRTPPTAPGSCSPAPTPSHCAPCCARRSPTARPTSTHCRTGSIELAGDDRGDRYRVLPPELTERDAFSDFWRAATLARVPASVRKYVRRRLLLDIELEFGLRSGVGRTLERTGSALAYVDVSQALLTACAREAVSAPDVQLSTAELDDAHMVAWVRGVLQRMRTRGAVDHEWFTKFRQEDGNRWWITGGRRRGEGMPGFGTGNSAPAYPILDGSAKDTDLEPVASARGWYAQWSGKVLGVPPARPRCSHGSVQPAAPPRGGRRCDFLLGRTDLPPPSDHHRCAGGDRRRTRGRDDLAVMLDLPRHRARPTGGDRATRRRALSGRSLRRHPARPPPRRQLLPADVRRHRHPPGRRPRTHQPAATMRSAWSTRPSSSRPTPEPNAPNVLVATPTLEMGIDIGDLSAVLLSSLPRTVASYVQRVGRAGRLTGNALALAYVTGRGDQLPRVRASPSRRSTGPSARPPPTSTPRRSCAASSPPRWPTCSPAARRAAPPITPAALRSTAPGTYLGELISQAEAHADALVDAFLSGFPPLDEDVTARLRGFPQPVDGVSGTSELATRCHRASEEWNRRIEILDHRRSAVDTVLPELLERAELTGRHRRRQTRLRTAEATVRLINKQLADAALRVLDQRPGGPMGCYRITPCSTTR